MKIIYVLEDDLGIREMLKFLLEYTNYSVKVFSNVNSFEAENKNKIPDLYLLDIMLRDGNGYKLFCQLKEDEQTSDIPVILMSVFEDPLYFNLADDYIIKPFDIEDLLKKIKNQLCKN